MPPRDLTSIPTLDPLEDITRRRLLASLPAIGLFAAGISCGDDDDGATPSQTWTYESEFGPVELPRTIERIVCVDFYSPAALVDIGRVPVGVVNSYLSREGASIPDRYIQAVIDGGAQSIGDYWAFDVEAVAKADPDIILATDDFLPLGSPVREQMEQIAPIVTFTAHTGDSWRTRTDGIATILDAEDEMAKLAAQYEQARDSLRDNYPALQELTFAPVALSDGQWSVFPMNDASNSVLRDLGAHFIDQDVDGITGNDISVLWLSYERIRLLESADVILRIGGNSDSIRAEFAELAENPLWKNLPAVQHGMVFNSIDRSFTGSYGWGLDNLEDTAALFAEIQAALDAR